MNKAIRRKQRFDNFEKAYKLLQSAFKEKHLSKLEKEGVIQRFEYTFELSWKTLKDYLESQGQEAHFPREIIKHAFQSGLIEEGGVWIAMLEDRNLMAHTYDENRFKEAFSRIKNKYAAAIEQVYTFLKQQYK